MPWVLAVDFGTTNTVAAVADQHGVKVLSLNGSTVMPSAVFLDETGWLVGGNAVRSAQWRLDRYEPCPKRAIPDGQLFLGGEDVPVTEAITAVFRPLLAEALRQHGGRPPDLFVVTHPATWTGSRIDTLLAAAGAAAKGKPAWPRPHPMSEPEAAAQGVLHIEGIPAHTRLVVLDLGGGTTDVTVVDRHDDTLTVVGRPLGRDGLGGVDFDLRLARWMTAEADAPGLFDRLAASADPEARVHAADIRNQARDIKEQLSDQTVVAGRLAKCPPELPDYTHVQVSRSALESLIRGNDHEPGLDQAVQLVGVALREAPPGPELAGVFLVGGCSRIPLLGTLVTQRVGTVPIDHGDPTTAVAEGAARAGWGLLQGSQDRVRPGPAARVRTAPTPPPPPPPRQNVPAPPKRGGAGWKVAIALVALVLVGGGLFAYFASRDDTTTGTVYVCPDGTEVEYSYECPDGTDEPATGEPTQESFLAKVMVDVDVWESPSTDSGTVTTLLAGEKINIYCRTSGEEMTYGDTVSDLWGLTDDGYVPGVAVYVEADLDLVPTC